MKEKLLEIIKRDAVFEKEITLASGKKSNFYCDVRRVSLGSEGLYYISNMIWDIIKDDNITVIGGPTLGADPIVGGVCMAAHQNGKNLRGFLVRKEAKKHGRQNLIEGIELNENDRVVLIDDVATTGGSIIKALDVLKPLNVNVVRAMVVVDRQEGAQERFKELKCPLTALLTKEEILQK